MERLHVVHAVRDDHFQAMSLIHALGWRDTYKGYVPDEYMAREITNDRWVNLFREDYEQNRCQGLLLYRDDVPVSCLNYGPARTTNYNAGQLSSLPNENYSDWGEIISFYTHPDERGKGYGGMLFEEACRRLAEVGHKNAFVFVLRENERGRRFYASHGFTWDGTYAEIPFPPDSICIDLRYTKQL